jgi:hypothetical protein
LDPYSLLWGAYRRYLARPTVHDGEDIHFIHVKSRHEDGLPLIMYGWPVTVTPG